MKKKSDKSTSTANEPIKQSIATTVYEQPLSHAEDPQDDFQNWDGYRDDDNDQWYDL